MQIKTWNVLVYLIMYPEGWWIWGSDDGGGYEADNYNKSNDKNNKNINKNVHEKTINSETLRNAPIIEDIFQGAFFHICYSLSC